MTPSPKPNQTAGQIIANKDCYGAKFKERLALEIDTALSTVQAKRDELREALKFYLADYVESCDDPNCSMCGYYKIAKAALAKREKP